MGQKVIIRFLVGIWVIVCVQKPSHHFLQAFRPLCMFKIVFRDSSLYPKQLSLFCLQRLISASADRSGYIINFCSMAELLHELKNSSLTTTRATIVTQGFFVITRQPLQLDRWLNPLRMRKVSLVLLKKTTFDWDERFAWGGLAKLGCFRFFDHIWRALDANPMDQNFGANCFWKLHDLSRR